MSASAGRHRSWPAPISQVTSTQQQAVSFKACTHLTWHVRIGKSDVCQGHHASPGRHRSRPTADDISQGLHAYDVACADRTSDVGQWKAASAKTCTNQPWRVRIGWATSASANGRQHQPIFTCILRGPYDLGKRSRPTAGVIGQVTLVVVCPHCRGLCKLLSQRRPWTACIGRGLCTSITRRRVWPSCISLGQQTLVSRRWTWHAHIYHGLHTLVSRRQTSPARIAFGLHTTVSQRRT